MSFVKARKRTEVQAPDNDHSNKCAANGCPLKGSISANGNRYVCCFHHSADGSLWPQVTEHLIQNENILLAISEVLRIGDIDWNMGKWQIMDRYFENDKELQPAISERNHKRWYEYRLNEWMMYLSGLTSKKPEPREPLTKQERRGNIRSLLGQI
jgi:hypothetical protein